MSKFLFLLILILFTSNSFCQVTPEAFIGMLPSIPQNACSIEKAEQDLFLAKVDSILELIDNERSRRNEEMEANSGSYQKQMTNKLSNQYGLSQEELKKLQSNKKMTQEEKDALINKALQNSGNISLDEVKNLKKMSKEGKEAWAEAYGTEKMAEIQSDPQKNQGEQLKNKNMYDLAKTQKFLLDSLMAIESKFGQQFAEIDRDPDAKIMLDNISKWEQEAGEMMGELSPTESAELEALSQKIKSEKDKYCNKYTPQYVAILHRYESYTKSCLPACYRLESISAQLMKQQAGVDMKQAPGQIGIGKVADYLGLLRSTFKYNLN